MVFKRLFNRVAREMAPPPPDTDGRTVYAIGDIHGRADLLWLLRQAVLDDIRSVQGVPLLIFLGDYIDRGPASREVIDLILHLRADPRLETVTLKGNHEETILRFLEDPHYGPVWVDHGGGATLTSYEVAYPEDDDDIDGWMAARDALAKKLGASHLDFYRGLEVMRVVGDYVFVHAGLRPGVPLDRQSEKDLLWIRHDFVRSEGPHDKVVVHGHTVAREAEILPHRIGVDTGAYATGVLTAVRLEGQSQRLLHARLPA